MKSMEAVV